MDAAPEGLRNLGRAPGLAGDTAPGPSRSGRRLRWRAAPADFFTRLPQALHEKIAAGTGARERAGLACMNRTLRDSLREFSASDKAVVQGRDVGSLEPLEAMLHDVQSRLSERPDLRARPLAVLAGRIGVLHEPVEQGPAFDAILASVLQVPAGQRRSLDAPLMMLAAQVAVLDPAEQAGALQRLLQAQDPHGSLAEGLHQLAGRHEDLPQAARDQASTQVRQWVGRLEPGPAGDLVDRLPGMTGVAQESALAGLLQGGSSLSPEHRAKRLVGLARVSGRLSEPVHLLAVRGILAEAGSLDPQPRWAVLEPLCETLHRLPVAEHASTWHAVVRSYLAVPSGQLAAAFEHLHRQVRTLRNAGEAEQLAVPLMQAVLQEVLAWWSRVQPVPADARHAMLLMCVQHVADLPTAARQPFFRMGLRSFPQMAEEPRRLMLDSLCRAVAALPVVARQPEWLALLQALEPLPPQQRVSLFEPMAAQIGGLPTEEARAAAFAALLQAHRGLPVESRLWSVLALGRACVALPRAQWPRALDQVLEDAAQAPGLDHRALGLLGLATHFCVAQPEADGPIGPAPLEGAGRDVRALCFDKVMARMPLLPFPPEDFVGCVNALNTHVMRLFLQRPHDAAFLTRVIESVHRLMPLRGE